MTEESQNTTNISFNTEGVKFILRNRTRLKLWITLTLEQKKRKLGEIAFVFCSDEHLLGINKQYLNHDTYTDIITFDYSKDDPELPISGDIFISIHRVKENAVKYSKSFEEELHRVIIHGTLHLLGYADKTKKEKETMTQQEDKCLVVLERLKS